MGPASGSAADRVHLISGEIMTRCGSDKEATVFQALPFLVPNTDSRDRGHPSEVLNKLSYSKQVEKGQEIEMLKSSMSEPF